MVRALEIEVRTSAKEQVQRTKRRPGRLEHNGSRRREEIRKRRPGQTTCGLAGFDKKTGFD